MANLVIAEHDNSSIKAPTLSALAAAARIGGETSLLVAGAGCDGAVQEACKAAGVKRVLVADDAAFDHFPAENLGRLVASLGRDYTHILTPTTTTGKNFMPRVAALLDVAQISDITKVVSEDTFERPIYAGNGIATVQSACAIKVITVRSTAFDPVPAEGGSAEAELLSDFENTGLSAWVSDDMPELERPELTEARVVVSGGRGMGSEDNFRILDGLADRLGAAVGASRAAVDSGYAPNDLQVGQTGKIVAPELYIAVGISGAIQHLAGMKDSKVIVAINKDEDAPIFQIADYGLVADLFQAVPELAEELEKQLD